MIEAKEQWCAWTSNIKDDLLRCDISEEQQDIGDKIAQILGAGSEHELLNASPLQIDLYTALLSNPNQGGKNLEANFHDYVNLHSYRDESNPFGEMKQYYPPCRKIWDMLPDGVRLSRGEREWVWVQAVLNAAPHSDDIEYEWVKRHTDTESMTIIGKGTVAIKGSIPSEVIGTINDVYLLLSQGRYCPFVLRD